jgi:hypothetical protein
MMVTRSDTSNNPKYPVTTLRGIFMSDANTTPEANSAVLPSLNTEEALKVDQEVLEKVPLIVTEDSPYTNDVTNKEEE